MSVSEQYFKTKCQTLLNEYGDILERALKEELEIIQGEPLLGKDAFETTNNVIRKEAFEEGMRRLIARINKWAKQHGDIQ